MFTHSYRRALVLAVGLVVLVAVQSASVTFAHHDGWHQLQLISLQCITTEDLTGADEAYLTIGGVRVWGGDLNDMQTANLQAVPAYWFTEQVNVELFDGDTGWFDDDDFLGRATLYATDVGTGDRTVYFTEDDAVYILTYRVN